MQTQNSDCACPEGNSTGTYIIEMAKEVNLDPGILYEAVIDLSADGLFTAHCINLAAGVLLKDLGLPNYFFENITKDSLKNILASIAGSIKIVDNRAVLDGSSANLGFDVETGRQSQRVRIATEEIRDNMEASIAPYITGHSREYYFSPENKYYTYIIRPGTVNDHSAKEFKESKFLFNLSDDMVTTPKPTRDRYEKFLKDKEETVAPLIEVFNLPETGETRFMFDNNFALPQLPVFRKIFEDHGLTLTRGYWEPYYTGMEVPSSITSLYIKGEINRKREDKVTRDLKAFLSFAVSDITDLYIEEKLSFEEMLFAGNAADFTHMFIYTESKSDREIMSSLTNIDEQDAFANRIHQSNKTEYVHNLIREQVKENPDLIKILFELFDKKFNPNRAGLSDAELKKCLEDFEKKLASRFIDYQPAYDVFNYMTKIITCCHKTNFYKSEKRSFAFRFNSGILDPIVFSQTVYGIFYVNGHYACGTHLRAADIARGGLRLLRVNSSNYPAELDKAVLLNYALGPKAQRLKHKDICESGSKGVVVPQPIYAGCGMESLYDYTEGIMDLIMLTDEIVDHLGKPEMIFFGPDEGTAPLMDAVSYRTRDRGYKYWRTITTGKSFGIPHDTYGILENGDAFGLIESGDKGTDLQINGKSEIVTKDPEQIYKRIGEKIHVSGMTTTSVMSVFRKMIEFYGDKEEDLNLIMTGGPDGDLGANQVQTYKGKICLIVDGGSILYDPDGLDKKELMKIGFQRHEDPRPDSLAYPKEKLGPNGFKVERKGGSTTLPDGTKVDDCAIFHKNFLTDPNNRRFFENAKIEAFVPCGGMKDTINHDNVHDFTHNFQELKYIVEGANVFFDDSARRHIASETNIKQIKDSTANKGGVSSSSWAEVLTAFLYGDEYDNYMLKDIESRWGLIKNIMDLISGYSEAESEMLLRIHEKDKSNPLFMLSVQTSEQLLQLQGVFDENLDKIHEDQDLVWDILSKYIPETIITKLGQERILNTLNTDPLQAYRDAIITKKLAAMAFYKFGDSDNWDDFMKKAKKDAKGAIKQIIS